MKTFVPQAANLRFAALTLSIFCSFFVSAQVGNNNNTPQLEFTNGKIVPGYTDGADGAVYRFKQVTNDVDALVTITGRSSALVTLSSIDLTSTGFSKAFQPQISYNGGSVNSSASWWMEFQIQFVDKNTTNPTNVTSTYATALDIDGDDNKLKEWDAMYGATSYTVESNTQLSVSFVWGILGQLGLGGNKFLGTLVDHGGIDTTATKLMETSFYQNTNTITMRLGATTSGASSKTERMYSIYFKNFNYTAPMNTLPVQLSSFTATLNNTTNKSDLRWVTETEVNVSHFLVQRSTDGVNFSDAAMVFAYGNTTDQKSYSYSDNLASISSPVVYYRIASVDIDGKVQYSATRVIRIGKSTDKTIGIITYPNPATTELRVTLPATWQNKAVSIELIGNNGQSVSKMETRSSSQTETLNMSRLAPGFYLVKATCGEETAQQKVIKQ